MTKELVNARLEREIIKFFVIHRGAPDLERMTVEHFRDEIYAPDGTYTKHGKDIHTYIHYNSKI